MAGLAPSSSGPTAVVTRGRRDLHPNVSISWSHTLTVDTSAKQVLLYVATRMAQHFRDSLLRGVRHDTGAPLPRDRDGTPVAVHTGWMARSWLIGGAKGSDQAAQLEVRVNIPDRGRAIASRRWPLLQSTGGAAGAVLQLAHTEALAKVLDPARTRFPAGGGILSKLEAFL